MSPAPPRDALCPPDDALVSLLEGTSEPAQRRSLEQHIDTCAGCRGVLANYARLFGPKPTPVKDPERLGRYRVLRRLGAGGMGVVYVAHDPSLDRQIALKVVRPEVLPQPELRERSEREARAMAKLAHPNVVAVYDVGTEGEHLYIAMELVEGQTLRGWLQEQPRTLPAVAKVFAAAGEGLSAAHRAGLIHRDFKPENVLVGTDGRVRVTDFGLAARQGARPVPPPPAHRADREDDESDDDDERLTREGTLVGTPGYLAPELERGAAASPASDVYAFCVVLQEALAKQRLTPPRGLLRQLELGLVAEPSARLSSIRPLVAALDQIHRPRRWPYGVAGALGSAGVVVAFAVALLGRPPTQCRGATARMDAVWSASRASALGAAFAATSAPQAAESSERVKRELDSYRERWLALHQQTCAAASRLSSDNDDRSLSGLRLRCLERRLSELKAMITTLGQVDRSMVVRAQEALGALEPVEACNRSDALMSQLSTPADPALQAKAEQLQASLIQIQAQFRLGGNVTAQADQALAEARALGQPSLLAAALYVSGSLAGHNGNPTGAVALLKEAAEVAARAQDRRRLVRTWSQLAVVTGIWLGKPELGTVWLDAAQLELSSLPNEAELEARLAHIRGSLLSSQEKLDEAKPAFQRALDLATAIGPRAAPERIAALGSLGSIARRTQRWDEARVLYQQALVEREKSFGPNHPGAGDDWNSLGLLALERESPGEALRQFEKAEAAWQRAFGPEHPHIAGALINQADALQELGRQQEALVRARRAVAMSKRLRPSGHPATAELQLALAKVLQKVGRLSEAREEVAEALDVLERTKGPQSAAVARALVVKGELELEAGQRRVAAPLLGRAVKLLEGLPNAPELERARGLLLRAKRARG